jgi:predicted nucleic acid-binding Zn ribbon protein
MAADSEPVKRKPAETAQSARRRVQRKVLADWRGVYVPPDLSGYERKVGDVVARVMKRAGVEDRLNHEEVAANWESTVGAFLSKHSRPVSLRRGVLHVAVLQASVRYDLERRWKPDILLRLQERYGKQKVRDVKFSNG